MLIKKLININTKVTSKKKKKKHLEAQKKLNDLPGEIKLVLTKGLTKDLIYGYNILIINRLHVEI